MWQACQCSKVVQRGPKGTKMVNLSLFDHLGPRLGPSGPFWTISDKNDFFAPNGQNRVLQRCFGAKYQFLFEMVQRGPDGPKRVPNGQKQLGWPFRTTLECWQACHVWPFLFVLLVRLFWDTLYFIWLIMMTAPIQRIKWTRCICESTFKDVTRAFHWKPSCGTSRYSDDSQSAASSWASARVSPDRGFGSTESRLSETMKVLAVLLAVCLLASDGERIVRRTAYSHQDQMKVLPKNALRGSTNHFKKLIGRDFPHRQNWKHLQPRNRKLRRLTFWVKVFR